MSEMVWLESKIMEDFDSWSSFGMIETFAMFGCWPRLSFQRVFVNAEAEHSFRRRGHEQINTIAVQRSFVAHQHRPRYLTIPAFKGHRSAPKPLTGSIASTSDGEYRGGVRSGVTSKISARLLQTIPEPRQQDHKIRALVLPVLQ